jgi:adenylylsulfate kinase-like enzyme
MGSEEIELSFNQEGAIIWFTSLSDSGKTTLSKELRKHLIGFGGNVYILDGDILRQGWNSDLGFSIEDRKRIFAVSKRWPICLRMPQ